VAHQSSTGNAKIAGFEKDLGLSGYDYNALLSIFYVSYILFEIPSNIACKWIGPGWFIPAISLGFGIASLVTAFVDNFSQAAGVRFLLGAFEAGMMPGIAYYMSRWYRRSELTFRLSLYIVMAPMAGAFGGLLASGILTLKSFGGVTGWRMIFVIEGLITALLSIIALVNAPTPISFPSQQPANLGGLSASSPSPIGPRLRGGLQQRRSSSPLPASGRSVSRPPRCSTAWTPRSS
jgi:MFS family permease